MEDHDEDVPFVECGHCNTRFGDYGDWVVFCNIFKHYQRHHTFLGKLYGRFIGEDD